MDTSPIDRDLILEHLARVLASDSFRRAERSSALLRFLVEQTVNGQAERLKEYTLGVEALGRGDSFDPRTDPIVRAEASRLRARLERYYQAEGKADAIVLTLSKGSYVPQFVRRAEPDDVGAAQATHAPSSRFVWRWPAWVALFGVLTACLIAAAVWARRTSTGPGAPPLLQFDVELKGEGVLGSDVGTDLVLSPDGTRLVFVSRDPDGLAHLNVRRLDQSKIMRLPDTDGARAPFISPDGRWVGFWAAGKLKKTPVDGGAPVVLCDATDLFGASWEAADTIIAALNPTGRLWRIPAAGGAPEAILDLSAELAIPAWPQVLPGGQAVIYTALKGFGADRATIEAQAFQEGERKVLVRGGTYGRYLPNGYLTYVNQGTLYAVPFDVSRLEVQGEAFPVLDDISYSRTFGYAQMNISQTGTLVYRKGAESEHFIIEWLDRSGKIDPLSIKPGRYEWLRLSPDGQRLAYYAVESGAGIIWIYDNQRKESQRVTSSTAAYNSPMWWADSRFLVLGGRIGMAWIDADHPGEPQPLTTSRNLQVPWSFTPDGKRLAYYEMSPATGFDLWTVPVKLGHGLECGSPDPLLQTSAFECYPSFSPDGRWVAYASNETGTWEVYVRAFPDNSTKVRISSAGGSLPKWSPNGRELLYRTSEQHIMVTAYKTVGRSFVVGAAQAWSPQALGDTGVLPNFDLAPDGQRVVALMPVASPEEQQSQNHVTFMLNFLEEVHRRSARKP